MWIFLHKNDARRILDLDNKVGRLTNDVKALQDRWDTERIALADIKEQVLNTLRRLEQRETRARRRATEEKTREDALGATIASTPRVDPITQKIMARRLRGGLSAEHEG